MTAITADLVLRAYTIGFFPMAEHREDAEIFWVSPDNRGVLPLDKVHVPTKLRNTLRHNPYHVACNRDFAAAIDACAAATPKRPDTWISPAIRALYMELHRMGYAHSIEVWEGEALVGGLYGVALGGAFFGESMFSRKPDTSKIALMHLVARLKHGGFTLLDTQFTTKHLEQFGTVEIPREDYLDLLQRALKVETKFFAEDMDNQALLAPLLQSSTSTS